MVLDVHVAPTAEELLHLNPPRAKLGVLLPQQLVFLWCPRFLTQPWIDVVTVPLADLTTGPIQLAADLVPVDRFRGPRDQIPEQIVLLGRESPALARNFVLEHLFRCEVDYGHCVSIAIEKELPTSMLAFSGALSKL